MPLLRCDICGCAVSQVKSVFVCDQCQPPDATIAALHARVAELEAAQRWIPVTERLPEIPDNSEWEDRFVLCTFENPDGRRYVLETHYLDGEFSVGDEISIDFTPPNYIGQMYEGKDTKLVAWMYKPLPQPPEVK